MPEAQQVTKDDVGKLPNNVPDNGGELTEEQIRQALMMSEEEYEKGDMEDPGPVGGKIESATVQVRQFDDGGKSLEVNLEVTISSRPGTKVNPHKFWDNVSLDPKRLRKFRNLVKGSGLKLTRDANGKYDTYAAIKALPGRPIFGIITHRDWTYKGESGTKVTFGNKFGRSFEELRNGSK